MISHRNIRYALAQSLDDAAALMTENRRKFALGIFPRQGECIV